MDKNQSTSNRRRQQLLRQGSSSIPPEQRIKDLPDLQRHLQTALELEHSTIPPYLCALYSIKEGYNVEAAQIIKSVVLEEMLHMILAANVLNAIGGKPCINHAEFIPVYPTYLPHSDNAFIVGLERFSKRAIETFLLIERPANPQAPPEANNYHTIAQFYEAIELGLKELSASESIFKGNISRQITPEYYYGGGGEAIPVTDLDSALQALYEITGQGEGIHHTIFDGDQEQFGEVQELAHYFRFNEIRQEQRYTDRDTPTSGPSGETLLVQWDQVYPMRPNPKMKDYRQGSEVWHKMYEFNRTYMSLLNELHDALNGEPQRLMQSVAGMYDLKYQAIELMKIPVGDGDMSAGPSFEYIPNSRT